MKDIGKQYEKGDNRTDPSGFLRKARLHQSNYRANVLRLECDTYGNYLIKEDAKKGFNFYDGFNVFKAVEEYRSYNKPLYANMLRSEHIPFNLFVPFRSNLEYCKKVFNVYFKNTINSIDIIKIEHPPSPKEKYLNDGTSFDAYIEYKHIDNTKGIIGIEVKYTEKEYKLVPNSKQEKDVNNPTSRYYEVTKQSDLYFPEAIDLLKTDLYRQVWRNHILGASILMEDKEFKHFTSLTIFPKGNKHFAHTSEDYIKFLKNKETFLPLTFESFLETCDKLCPDASFKSWINYLYERYIVADE